MTKQSASLREFRRTFLGVSIRDLERLHGIDRSYLSKVESGTVPNAKRVPRLATIYGLTIEGFYRVAGLVDEVAA
ncbi:MAG: helix-turn-helix transcriptional regulator [Acidobacteriota bacterium]